MVKTFYFKSPHYSEGKAIDETINAWALQNNAHIISTSSGGYAVDLIGAYLFVTVTYEQPKPVLDEKTL